MEISFYIFKLDFLKEMNEFLIAAILLIIVMTILYYAILITMHSPDILKEDDTADFTQDEDRYSGNSNPFGGDTPFGRVFDNINNSRPRRPKRRFDDNNFKQFLTIASHQLTALRLLAHLRYPSRRRDGQNASACDALGLSAMSPGSFATISCPCGYFRFHHHHYLV